MVHSLDARREALAALVKIHETKMVPILLRLLNEPQMRVAAIRALAVFEDPAYAEKILAIYKAIFPLPNGERR